MGVLLRFEDVLEILTAGRQNQFMSFHLFIVVSYNCHIKEVIFISEDGKGIGNV